MSIRVSASRLKTFKECSVKFWYEEYVNLPEETHWKTKVGSIVHLLFECCLNPRRAALLRAALKDDTWRAGQFPTLARFILWQLRRFEVTLSSVDEVSELLRVAFIAIKPHFDLYFAALDAGEPLPFTYHTEKRFQMQVGEATMSGFIDLLLVWSDRALVMDLKTQREKFTRADVPNNIQAAIYQLACKREFGFVPAVEFIMLRHPPSKRYPVMHIQRVEAPSLAHLAGLEVYIEGMFSVVNALTEEQALSHPHDDEGFCKRVCQYHKPFTYWARVKRDDPKRTPIETYLLARKPEKVAKDETLVPMQHAGCVARWRN